MNNEKKDVEVFERLIRLAYEERVKYKELLKDKYPSNYTIMILEDEYVNHLCEYSDKLFNELLTSLFSVDHMECASWFLWDWIPGCKIIDNGIHYIINDLDDYLKYKKETWDK